MSSLLNEFIEFPNNFWEWMKESSFNNYPFYSLEEAKFLYKKHNRSQIGFIYRKYQTKNVSMDIANYPPYDIIPQIEVSSVSVGRPDIFFGSFADYKKLIFRIIEDQNKFQNKFNYYSYNKYFFDFGKTYLFSYNQIKGPLEVLEEIT